MSIEIAETSSQEGGVINRVLGLGAGLYMLAFALPAWADEYASAKGYEAAGIVLGSVLEIDGVARLLWALWANVANVGVMAGMGLCWFGRYKEARVAIVLSLCSAAHWIIWPMLTGESPELHQYQEGYWLWTSGIGLMCAGVCEGHWRRWLTVGSAVWGLGLGSAALALDH